MLFDQVTDEHIKQGIKDFGDKGYPKGFGPSSTYDLVFEGKKYPPKAIMAYANYHAIGRKIKNYFKGGEDTDCFKAFERNGFEVIPKNIEMEKVNVKKDFAEWLLKNAPESYNYYLGGSINTVIERLDEINGFYTDRNLFLVDRENQKELISYINFRNSKKERIKNKGFEEYNRKNSNGIPAAILGKNNYFKFLKEQFESTTVNYWIFQGNPDTYDIKNALIEGHLRGWKVESHKDKIKIGDRVIIWQTGNQAGCYALAEVTSNVGFFIEATDELQHYIAPQTTGETERVKLKIVKNLSEHPILWSQIRDLPEFSNFNAGNQGTNFSATKTEYNKLLTMQEHFMYSWVQTHKELTEYFARNKEKQLDLVRVLKKVGITGLHDENEEGKRFELKEIDPFTFFCYIYKYGSQKRLKYLQDIALELNITKPLDDEGIPSVNAQKVCLFPYERYRKNNEISRLWGIFESALNDTITNEQFQDVLNINSTGKTKLTEGLFNILPDKFFPINGPTKPFIAENFGINPNFKSYSEYKEILKQIRSKTNIPFYQLSHEARLWNKTSSANNASELKIKEMKTNITLNTILFGPPGTGKTYKLREKYFDMFTVSESSLSKEQFIVNIVADLTWWQTFAIALYDLGKTSVNQLLEHEIVKAKTSLSNAKNIRPIAWSRMQAHAVPECPNVNVVDRSEPSLFYKELDSEWRVVNEKVDSLYPEGIELLEQIRNFTPNEDTAIKNFEFVTFHQSFGYEDFVEGIKPKLEEGNSNLEYEIKDGIFKKLCQRALQDPQNKYAIFIDEINRGNVSAIFGELITLIEDDKRIGSPQELKLKLPYSKTEFGVPSNLYIIGTMNTADRSVEALDTALRRRFVFEEVMPDPVLLSDITFDGFSLEQVLTVINDRIEVLLDRDHTIGHSYFIKLKSGDTVGLSNVFKNNIIPLLQEYFYNDYEKIALVLGSGFVEEKGAKKVTFPKYTNIAVPDLEQSYELITKIEDIEEAVGLLLGVSNE